MAQGDKRLTFNTRERFISDDMNRLQAIEAAERAARLRGVHNDIVGDWYSSGGLQTPVVSSAPSLLGDVYGGLMVQPDNAGYFLVQPGVAGFLDPTGVGTDDNAYRVVNDPGQQTPAVLAFTSNGGGGAPRWDVIECQPVDTVVAQESRYIFNPATGIASPILVDKVKAGRLTYRVRTGVVGAGFPGLAAGWMPLAVCCAPAGSSSLLTSDVWDVRPLVRERVRRTLTVNTGSGAGFSPIPYCEYLFRDTSVSAVNCWQGSSESSFNGYEVGGKLTRSTPSTLAQFGVASDTGGRSAILNADQADNQTGYAPAANSRLYAYSLFPFLLPRWQRYSQVPVGLGRVPDGPRGILVVSTTAPKATGIAVALGLPAAAAFGATTHPGVLLGTARCTGVATRKSGHGQSDVHYTESQVLAASSIGVEDIDFDFATDQLFPIAARRIFVSVSILADNGAGDVNPRILGRLMAPGEFFGTIFDERVAGVGTATCNMSFTCWVPTLPRGVPTDPAYGATMRLRFSVLGIAPSITSASIQVLGWSSAARP